MLKSLVSYLKGALASLSLKALWGWLRKKALAQLKEKLIEAIQKEGDQLQEQVKKAVLEKGPDAVDSVFDDSQKRIIEAIRSL